MCVCALRLLFDFSLVVIVFLIKNDSKFKFKLQCLSLYRAKLI